MKLSHNAFTLVELLITVSIVVILSTAVIPSFSSYIRTQNLKQALDQVKSDLRTVQNNALNDALPLNNTVENPKYWGMYFEKDSHVYYYFVSPDTSSCSEYARTDQDFNLSEFITPSNNYCVYFSFENGNVYGDKSIGITDGKGTECIKLNDAGLISVGVWDSNNQVCN